MKGIVLAGGLGTRLHPLTLATNKHLLPVYDKPMIYYPINTLSRAGIDEVMIVVSGPFAGDFIPILKNGQDFGLKSLRYAFQDKPNGGIADALSLAEEFANGEPIAVILGDNTTDVDISQDVERFKRIAPDPNAPYMIGLKGSEVGPKAVGWVFLREVPDPHRFGVATVTTDSWQTPKVLSIEEKPDNPQSNLAVTGLYLYDYHVWKFIRRCAPSHRNELEITDVNNHYINEGTLFYSGLEGAFWKDAGTFDSLIEAGNYWAKKNE